MQLPAARSAATPSPMSSTPIVNSSLTQRLAVQAMKSTDTIAAKVAAAANGPQPSMPRPVTTRGRLWGMARLAVCCTPRA